MKPIGWYVLCCLLIPALWGWLATLIFDMFIKKRLGNVSGSTQSEASKPDDFWNYDI
jgi:hypothetical protein